MDSAEALGQAPLIVAATGRFQSRSLHQGHLQYIAAGRRIANEEGAPFVILTGPHDDELLDHEGLRFEDRRKILSAATGVSPELILNHGGAPRGERKDIAKWASGFFAPIRAVSSLEVPVVDLVIVRKPDDIKDYGFGYRCHYSDLLVMFVSGVILTLRDVTPDMTHLELSTRYLRHTETYPP